MTGPKLKKIVQAVLIAHLVLLLFFMISLKSSQKKVLYAQKTLRENVRVIEKPKPKKVIAQAKKNKVVVSPKKTMKKPPIKVASKKTLPKLEKVPELPKESVASLVLPPAVTQLGVEEVEEQEPEGTSVGRYGANVQALITQEFKCKLKPGCSVEIELTLKKDGEVLLIKHICSSDNISKDYVIENVKEMKFPDFFGEIATESEYTFPLVIQPRELL